MGCEMAKIMSVNIKIAGKDSTLIGLAPMADVFCA